MEKKVNPDPVNERLNRLALENVEWPPVWIGWDKLNPTYTADIMVNGDLDRIEIDPNAGWPILIYEQQQQVPGRYWVLIRSGLELA